MASYYNTAGLASDSVFDLMVQLLPRGAARLYGLLAKRGDPYNFGAGLADSLAYFVFSGLAQLRQEINPQTTFYKLGDYESWLGLTQTAIALTGSTQQRRNQIVSKLREQGATTVSNVGAILGPLLGYNPATPVQVIEADPSALRLLHTYGFSGDVTIANTATATISVWVPDGGTVSDMGAQLTLAFSAVPTSGLSVTLTGPDGAAVTWNQGWQYSPVTFASTAFYGKQINGTWQISITNNTGGSLTVYDGPCLFVEGIARNQETGGAIFTWGVYANPAHTGESGSAADFSAARAAITRVAYAFTQGNLIQSLTPYPDTISGVNAAIPNECVPT